MASKDHGLTPIELSSFCSEIALMLGAGMPLYAGMEALEKTYEDDAHAALYRGVSAPLTPTGSLRAALESGRCVVTSNKELVAEKGAALLAIAKEHGAPDNVTAVLMRQTEGGQ